MDYRPLIIRLTELDNTGGIVALVFQRWFLNVSLVDGGDNKTRRRYELRATENDFAAAGTQANDIIAALSGVTDAAISSYQLEKVVVESALAFPAITVHVEDRALLTVAIDGSPNKSATLDIPAPKAAIFVGPSGQAANTVDTTDPLVTAYHDRFKVGASCYVSDGQNAGVLRKGVRAHKSSGNG